MAAVLEMIIISVRRGVGDGGSRLAAGERGGNSLNGLKTFALKMAQGKAKIWP